MVGENERLDHIGRLARFKSSGNYHEGFKQATVHPQAADAVARYDAEAPAQERRSIHKSGIVVRGGAVHDKFITRLLLAVGEARRTKAVEYDLEHFKVLWNAKCCRAVGMRIENVPQQGDGALQAHVVGGKGAAERKS
jgi:hypothetical protein